MIPFAGCPPWPPDSLMPGTRPLPREDWTMVSTAHDATLTPRDLPQAKARKPWYRLLYAQVLIAILLGGLLGWLEPAIATNEWIKALGDGFVKLIKMVIAPIIFCTVVSGISHIQDARKVGRV